MQSQEVYINRLWQFKDGDFYVYLNFKDGYDWIDPQDLDNGLGDFVYKGDESSRRRLTAEMAKKYFELNYFNALDLYDVANLGELTFKGVEHYQDLISDSYVAVFENSNFAGNEPDWSTDYYCMSSLASNYTTTKFEVERVENEETEKKLALEFNFSNQRLMKLVTRRTGKTTLSVLSFSGINNENNSYIIQSVDNQFESLKNLKDEYVMWDFIPTPLMVNQMPVLIMEMGVPETDHNWTQIAVFDGTKYELLTNNFIVNLK